MSRPPPAAPICLRCSCWLAVPESLKASPVAGWGLCGSQKVQKHRAVVAGRTQGTTTLETRWDATCGNFLPKEPT